MHDLFATRRGTLLYLAAWLVLGVLLASLIVLANAQAWINSLLFAVPVALLYAVVTAYSVYYMSRAFPLAEVGLQQVLTVFGLASVFSGLLWAVIANFWNALCQGTEWPLAGIHFDRSVAALVFGLGTLLYVLFGIAHYLMVEVERSRDAERRELESRLLAQEAELRMLRLQIDPHFLFNSLNSISALTSQDAAGARQMTLKLADFLRQSLRVAAHPSISLAEELALVGAFLGVEQVRFGERLRLQENVEDEALDCHVPPLIIQPLVENAVKHGIAQLPEGGLIRMDARRQGARLIVELRNSIDPDLPSATRHGIGLTNVSRRLSVAYGAEADLVWQRQGAEFVVRLSCPAQGYDE